MNWSGLLWCFYQLFGLSFWRHPFTVKQPLVNKWWNAILQIWLINKLVYILDGLRVSKCSANFLFVWENYLFNGRLSIITNNDCSVTVYSPSGRSKSSVLFFFIFFKTPEIPINCSSYDLCTIFKQFQMFLSKQSCGKTWGWVNDHFRCTVPLNL